MAAIAEKISIESLQKDLSTLQEMRGQALTQLEATKGEGDAPDFKLGQSVDYDSLLQNQKQAEDRDKSRAIAQKVLQSIDQKIQDCNAKLASFYEEERLEQQRVAAELYLSELANAAERVNILSAELADAMGEIYRLQRSDTPLRVHTRQEYPALSYLRVDYHLPLVKMRSDETGAHWAEIAINHTRADERFPIKRFN